MQLALDLDLPESNDNKWDKRFMTLAETVASWSKDRSRGIGAVIVGPDRTIRALGYNGFPRGVDDNVEERHVRPDKYLWTEHAERNAIYNAVRAGTDIRGCTCYVNLFCCCNCARAIVQSSLSRVVTYPPDDDPRWARDFEISMAMFREAGVSVKLIEGSAPRGNER